MLFSFSCAKERVDSNSPMSKCTPENLPNQYKTIFINDLLPGATSNSPVAVFKFDQSLKSYSNTSCKSKSNECETHLKIQNISGYDIRVSYSINYAHGTNAWSVDGFADIMEDSTFDGGLLNCNCSWISVGSMEVLKKNVTYKN